jgi:quinoprotein glucose dehydrogenase
LGQVARKEPAAVKALLPLLGDRESEVRAQAARTLGDLRAAAAADRLVKVLTDAEPRVKFFTAQALGRIGCKEAIPAVLALLRANADKDAYLRHAGVMALAGTRDVPALLAVSDDSSASVRLGVLLALRRLHSPEIARFLADPEASLVLEAARALGDLPIEPALPQLAALVTHSGLSDALGYRVLNANFRLGQPANAEAVAAFAARPDAPETLRVEALRELAEWAKPAGRDRVMGLWRPLQPRPASVAADAVRPRLAALFTGPDKVRQEAAKLAAGLGIREIGPMLVDMAGDAKRPAGVRVEALRALGVLKDSRLETAMTRALDDLDPRIRTEGRRLLARLRPADALARLDKVLGNGTISECQGAFAILGDMKGPESDALLGRWLDNLLAGKVTPEVRLDLVEAAGKHPAVSAKLADYQARQAQGDALAPYRDALVGGDAEEGQRIFLQKAEVSCLRCHKVKGVGGEVGPDLTGIAGKQNREYLLESIVLPNKQIAKGFDTLVLTLKNGQSRAGVLKAEDAAEVRLMTPEGKLVVVPKDQIDERETGKSAMPEDLIKKLSRSEVRDLVEFLSRLK